MISIHSDEENELIRSYVEKQPTSPRSIWLGLKRNISLDFVWVDKSPVDYANWRFGEPDNRGGWEPYTEMWINEKNGGWVDLPGELFSFVCQINYSNE